MGRGRPRFALEGRPDSCDEEIRTGIQILLTFQPKVSSVFRIPRSNPWPPAIDLTTVRETLIYMKDDMRRVPALEGVAAALETALKEIDKAERTQKKVPLSPIAARFLPLRN